MKMINKMIQNVDVISSKILFIKYFDYKHIPNSIEKLNKISRKFIEND